MAVEVAPAPRDVPVTATTNLSYWLYPANLGGGNTNSSYVAVDLLFSDGSWLRNLGAVDQNGVAVSPSQQGASGRLVPGAWNFVSSNIGAVAAGKTLVEIDVGYDHAAGTAPFQAYLDDLLVF